MSQHPRITVGLVVHNGEQHLAAAIQSFLDQTYRDFVLVVYDNASNDATFEIAQSFAKIDSRVQVVRRPENIGSLRNWNDAVDRCETPLFCWAAHDDCRKPMFLQSLIEALDAFPEAKLACCDARIIDPDGSSHHVLQDTAAFRSTDSMTSTDRALMYLTGAPASPIFGLYRTAELSEAIQLFRDAADQGGPLLLWLDVVFLTRFFNRHHVAVVRQPHFLFRRGGVSHRIDLYRTMREFLAALREFRKLLMGSAGDQNRSIIDRVRLRIAMDRYYFRTIFGAPVRRMFWHHLSRDFPIFRKLHARWTVMRVPAFRRLRRRMCTLPAGARVVILGAGKHTRRCMDILRCAIEPHARIVGICDDAAAACAALPPFPVVAPEDLHSLNPELILISSDTYETALHRRASEIAPQVANVWCIYDPTLESDNIACSAASTELRNESISSITSAAA